jgi:hypothetical protein
MVPGTALWCRALFRRRAAQAGQMRSSVFLPLRVRALGRSRLGLPPHPVRRPILPGNGSGRISGCWTSQVPKRRTHKAAAESSEHFHVGCAFDKVDPENPIERHGDTHECPSDAAPKADNRDLSSPSTPGGTKKEPPARRRTGGVQRGPWSVHPLGRLDDKGAVGRTKSNFWIKHKEPKR